MNYTTDDLFSRLLDGDSLDTLAEEFTKSLNAAKAQHDEHMRKLQEEEEKRRAAEEAERIKKLKEAEREQEEKDKIEDMLNCCIYPSIDYIETYYPNLKTLIQEEEKRNPNIFEKTAKELVRNLNCEDKWVAAMVVPFLNLDKEKEKEKTEEEKPTIKFTLTSDPFSVASLSTSEPTGTEKKRAISVPKDKTFTGTFKAIEPGLSNLEKFLKNHDLF